MTARDKELLLLMAETEMYRHHGRWPNIKHPKMRGWVYHEAIGLGWKLRML